MQQFVVIVLFLASAHALSYGLPKFSAASAGQIKFANENKYDDTGPGAKEPEYAYQTYKTLEEALVAYLDDPDTKLPEHEKAKAIANLYKVDVQINDIPKRVDAFTGNKPNIIPIVLSTYNKYDVDDKGVVNGFKYETVHSNDIKKDPYKWQKAQAVKASRLSISHYNKDNEEYDYKPDPRVPFSHDMHNTASGPVHGYYSVMDADGKHRTVQYQSDPRRGFRSTVHRIYHN